MMRCGRVCRNTAFPAAAARWPAQQLTRSIAARYGGTTGHLHGLAAAMTPLTLSLTQRAAIHNSALEAAMRVTSPSAAHPATGPNTPNLQPEDPRVLWREHMCPRARRPYYHNLATNELSWAMPLGFPTRFESFYAANPAATSSFPAAPPAEPVGSVKGQRPRAPTAPPLPQAEAGVAEAAPSGEHAEHPAAAPTTAHNAVPTSGGSLKQRLKQFGPGGFCLYLIIHNTALACIFLSLMYGVDVAAAVRRLGFKFGEKSTHSLFGTFILAVAINKLFVPLQLLLTLALAPIAAPRLTVLCRAAATRIFGWS